MAAEQKNSNFPRNGAAAPDISGNIVDLLTLSEAQKVYLIQTGKMYLSHFAETASFINNRPYEVIRF